MADTTNPPYREDVLRDRKTWIARLLDPSSKKATLRLADGEGGFCCLGHGCEALGIEYGMLAEFSVGLRVRVGLHSKKGDTFCASEIMGLSVSSLAEANDFTKATPQQIGAYLDTVIEGGPDTPFSPLTDFPERPSEQEVA